MTANRTASRHLADRLAVYLVADPEQTDHDLVAAVATALQNGVTAVQLRAKHLPDRSILALAVTLRDLCRASSALFLVNDRVDVALAADADGVHLGVHDLPLAAARRLAPAGFVIGFSPETDEQTAAAAADGADYVGVGPVFATASKDDAYEPIGLTGVARLARIAGVPTVGIGGITPETAADVVQAGAVGVAVIGAVLRAPDVAEATRRLATAVGSARVSGQR
jgi:thiamine-phosphate diphosphorylase